MKLHKRSRAEPSQKFTAVLATALLLVLSLLAGVTVAVGPLQAAKTAPDGPIGELTVEKVTHKTITVSWLDVGSSEGYVLSWWKKGAKNKTRVDVPVDGTRYTIKGLKPDKEYAIRVFTVKDSKRHGKYRSDLLTQRTLPAPSARPPTAPPDDGAGQQSQLPQITLTAGASITEGDDAVFHCKADPAPPAAIDGVTVAITQVGDFTTHTTATIRIDADSDCGTIRIPTLNDAQSEPDGSIEVALQSDNRFDASTDSVIVVVVDDDQLENVSIAAGPDIVEGQPARFTITATPMPTAP